MIICYDPRVKKFSRRSLPFLFFLAAMTPLPAADAPPLRYLALGDSYTIGEGVALRDRWPAQFVETLKKKKVFFAAPQYIARTGWTTRDLQRAIDYGKPQGPYKVVTLSIGVNNQYQGRSLSEYRNELVSLINAAVALAGGEKRNVLLMSIPDWGVSPFAERSDRRKVGAEIDQFNKVMREEAARAGVRFVDITPLSREKTGAEQFTDDGLHPSGAMYKEWAALAAAEILSTKQ